jgi:hypothetical protein
LYTNMRLGQYWLSSHAPKVFIAWNVICRLRTLFNRLEESGLLEDI